MESLAALLEIQRRFFRSGATRPLSARREALKKLKAAMEEHGDLLAGAIGKDLGRCWLESWSSEPGVVLADTRHALKHLFFWSLTRYFKPSPVMIPGFVRSRREPFGTVVIIGPWNYPAGLLLAPMVSALAGGNTVILKPSERAPETAAALKTIIGEYFDEKLVAVVQGGGDTARWLVRNAADMVCFTGSGDTGRKVMADAATRPVPLVLELGGVNPCYVDSTADIRETARRIAWGKFFAAGQTCLAPNHVYALPEVFNDLLEELKKAVSDFYGEKPENSPDYGRIVDLAAWNRLAPMLNQGEAVTGGYGNREDLFIAPTVLTGVSPDSPLLSEEIFGPVLPVIRCSSVEEAMESCGTGDSSPLAAYGFSGKPREMEKLLKTSIRAGSLTVNGTLHRIVSSSIGFGGVGGSGFGRYRGREGYRSFTWERVVLRKNPVIEMPMIYPPYKISRKLVRMLARFF